jgi:hypothetical protein
MTNTRTEDQTPAMIPAHDVRTGTEIVRRSPHTVMILTVASIGDPFMSTVRDIMVFPIRFVGGGFQIVAPTDLLELAPQS